MELSELILGFDVSEWQFVEKGMYLLLKSIDG